MDSVGDEAVAATNCYAAICKYQAASSGYYKDDYLRHFLSPMIINSSQRKAPEILRGYYARSASVAFIVEQFIFKYPNGQVINLGAGYDTLYWRLKSKCSEYTSNFKFVEVDMANITMHKIKSIRRHQELSKSVCNIRFKGDGMHSDQYHILTFDLRQVDKSSLLRRLTEDCNLDLNVPTLCIAECVLVFMPIENSNSLIHWFSLHFKHPSFINYEQCNIYDRFGNIMQSSLSAQHCDLMGAEACRSLQTQKDRFFSNGFDHVKAWTLSQIYHQLMVSYEKERIEKIEFLDERELLDQLLDHYCLVVASKQDLDWITENDNWQATACSCDD